MRTQYKSAVHALQTGRTGEFRRALRELEGYALHPYLVYYDVESRLRHVPPSEAVAARNALATMPLGERLYGRWLVAQARRGRWQVYRDYYEPQQRVDARCYHARALYRTGDREAALALVPDLWVAGQSQPKACDPLFEVWMAAGGRTEELTWQRLGLAIEQNERTLARYLLRFFSGSRAKAAQAYYDGHVRPEVARQSARFPDTEYGHQALAHTLTRYARSSPRAAAATWEGYRKRGFLPDGIRKYVEERVTLALARLGEFPSDTDPADPAHSPAFRAGMAEANIAHLRWARGAAWIDAFDTATRDTLQWRYWLGRALVASGDDPQRGEKLLRTLAGHRNYYGFLAADRLGIEPSLNERGVLISSAVQRQLRQNPAIERMTELYAVGDLLNARREWYGLYDHLSTEDRRGLVELASDMGWIEQAIIGASQAELTDHLALRFPTPFLGIYLRHAFETDLPVSFLFAISRQESAFNPRAVSPAGARGLMQLMAATGAGNRVERPHQTAGARGPFRSRHQCHARRAPRGGTDGPLRQPPGPGGRRVQRRLGSGEPLAQGAAGHADGRMDRDDSVHRDPQLRPECAGFQLRLRQPPRQARARARGTRTTRAVIDIGANLTGATFDADRVEVIARARDAGVSGIVVTGTNVASAHGRGRPGRRTARPVEHRRRTPPRREVRRARLDRGARDAHRATRGGRRGRNWPRLPSELLARRRAT